jgi:DNA-binding SARP family transcriptional activator
VTDLRIFLAGELAIEHRDILVRGERFPGLQGRIVFAMLAAEHRRSLSRTEIEEELWGEAPPPASDVAIRALASKLRALLASAGLESITLANAFGAYQLVLPTGTWVDVEAAAQAIHRAEPALREGTLGDAVGWGRVADSIAMRPFLDGADGPWVRSMRERLRGIRLRALECLSAAWLRLGDPAQAARDAAEGLALDPFREPSHRLLIRSLFEDGDRAGALRAYERCRSVLAEELGANPSPETEGVYLEVLRSS